MLSLPAYPCGEGHTVRCVNDMDREAYTAAINTLVSVGWRRYDVHTIADNRFDTLQRKDGSAVLFASFYAASRTARFVSGGKQFLPRLTSTVSPLVSPITPPEHFARVVQPSVTQLGRKGATQSAAGLSLVIQLCDGRFVVIDGGPCDNDDADALLAFLQAHTPHGRPVIATWFITHAHKDHVGLAGEFLARHGDAVNVQLAAYNFPDFDAVTITHESAAAMAGFAAPFCNEVRRKGIPVWRLHSGQRMAYPACTVEVLYTQEEHYPAAFPWGNHTSCVLRFLFEEKRLLVLGDCETTGCEHIARHFRETMKCDILQLSHHGLNGASTALYAYADPEICFWPIDEQRFCTHPICRGDDPLYAFNAWIRDDTVRRRTHYHASKTHTILL